MAKNMEGKEDASKLKTKHYIKMGKIDMARVHAENAIRHRFFAQYYLTIVANAAPYEFDLRQQLSGGLSTSTQKILSDLDQLKNHANNPKEDEISSHQINTFIQELSENVQLDMLHKLPQCADPNQSDINERLQNLRRQL